MTAHNITIAPGDTLTVTVAGVPVPAPPTPVPPPPDPGPPPPSWPGLNASIAALPAGGQLTVPGGSHVLTEPLSFKRGQVVRFADEAVVSGGTLARWITVGSLAHDVTVDFGKSRWRNARNPIDQGAIVVDKAAERTHFIGGDFADCTGPLLRAAGFSGLYERMDIHHAGHLGIHYGDGRSNTFRGGALHENSLANPDQGWEAGGAKGVGHSGIVFEDMDIWGNRGPGIWSDSVPVTTIPYAKGLTIRRCRVHGNAGSGLFIEITDGAEIADNVVWDNGGAASTGSGVAYGPGNITIASGRGARIHGNTVVGGLIGINVFTQKRADSPGYGDNQAWDNDIVARVAGWVGLAFAADTVDTAVQTAHWTSKGWGNRFWWPAPEGSGPRFAYGGGYRSTLAQLNSTRGGKGDNQGASSYLSDPAPVLARLGG